MSDATTTSFSSAVTSTTISESTPAGGSVSATTNTSADSTHPKPVTSSFTSSTPSVGFSFGSALPSSSSSPSTFGSSSFTSTPSIGATADDGASTDDPEVAPEEESTARFTPVVRLTEVAVTTGEEDDEVLYTQRSALYRFDSSVNEWKERGKGDVKLLRNKTSGKVRLLMRQEKTLKLCANHLVLPSLDLKPNAGSDRSWTWRCEDYAAETAEVQTFAIRFKDSDTANQFKAKWDEVKESNAKLLGDKEKA